MKISKVLVFIFTLLLITYAGQAQKRQKVVITSGESIYFGIDSSYYKRHLADSLKKWFGKTKAAKIIDSVDSNNWPRFFVNVMASYDTTIIGNYYRKLNIWKIATIEKNNSLLEVRPEDNRHLNEEGFKSPFYMFVPESDEVVPVKEWANEPPLVVNTKPVPPVTVKKENKEIVSVKPSKQEPELSDAKAKAVVAAAVKSKMVPGDKIVIDTIIVMQPGNFNQTIINSNFDDKFNRTLYVAVKENKAAIEINTLYGYKFVELPELAKSESVVKGIRIYRVSFTGPIKDFDIVHNVEQDTAIIYVYLTKRMDEKGYVASKNYVEEWDAKFAEDAAKREKKRKENEKQNSEYSSVANELKKLMKSIYESVRNNNLKLHSSPQPSLTEIDRIIKDAEGKYKDLKNYLLTNENKIKSFAGSNSTNSAFMNKMSDAIMEVRSNFQRIDNTVKDSNANGGKINIGNLYAAFRGIQDAAYTASELSY